jgi:uncharacterized damage-inducible protein DinB
MASLAPLIEAWDEGHWEFGIALGGLPDEELWTRPHARLLSVGELTAHVAYAQAAWIGGNGSFRPDLEQLFVKSPLVDQRFSYYNDNVANAASLELGTAEVLAELKRVHDACKSQLSDKQMEDAYPGQWGTWGSLLRYQVFHVAYHAGQVYSVRHLLGHETEDN